TPFYHDMGLILGTLLSLYGGIPNISMSPVTFLQRPFRWLHAISSFRATCSCGSDFAYNLCLRKITQEQRTTLDLSSWTLAVNGAEPVRPETINGFVEAFGPCGFRREAFYPSYGLAEATLHVSGGCDAALPGINTLNLDKSELENNRVVEVSPGAKNSKLLIGCGQTHRDQKTIIVHPELLIKCMPDQIGEIWVSGLSITQGYWNRSRETAQTFHAYLSDTGEGPFLRTGDLGFFKNGELFITGRLKDLIIIRGRNLYPQDIEQTAERSHPALRLGGSAAFSVDIDGEEQLVVVQEVEYDQQVDVSTLVGAIRQAVFEDYEVKVYAVVLIKPGSIFKTSSGKIQRSACRDAFLAGSLDVWEAEKHA
ncbi:partial fatty acid CoA ligase FadD32, partial [Candidatus Brocadiaceae bacterium]